MIYLASTVFLVQPQPNKLVAANTPICVRFSAHDVFQLRTGTRFTSRCSSFRCLHPQNATSLQNYSERTLGCGCFPSKTTHVLSLQKTSYRLPPHTCGLESVVPVGLDAGIRYRAPSGSHRHVHTERPNFKSTSQPINVETLQDICLWVKTRTPWLTIENEALTHSHIETKGFRMLSQIMTPSVWGLEEAIDPSEGAIWAHLRTMCRSAGTAPWDDININI